MNEYDGVPFEAITYLTGECNYGGRVTDDWDRRLLMTTLADFYNKEVIEKPRFPFSPSGDYYSPPKSTYEDYIRFIKVKLFEVTRGRTRVFLWRLTGAIPLLCSRSFHSASTLRYLECMKTWTSPRIFSRPSCCLIRSCSPREEGLKEGRAPGVTAPCTTSLMTSSLRYI